MGIQLLAIQYSHDLNELNVVTYLRRTSTIVFSDLFSTVAVCRVNIEVQHWVHTRSGPTIFFFIVGMHVIGGNETVNCLFGRHGGWQLLFLRTAKCRIKSRCMNQSCLYAGTNCFGAPPWCPFFSTIGLWILTYINTAEDVKAQHLLTFTFSCFQLWHQLQLYQHQQSM